MRQTLFFIPHELAGIPVFGFGWILAVAIIVGIGTLAYLVKKDGWTKDTKSFLPFFAMLAAIIGFVLPMVEVVIQGHEQHVMLWQYPSAPDLPLLGLPIRGYGVFLLIATVSGVMLARYRAVQVGLSPDAIYNLAFYMFVGGILGARVFYIIQYWDKIREPAMVDTFKNMVNFVEGGLVVYGSLIGALIAAVIFLVRNKLPVLPVADLIAPSLALGLAIGRIGCLMNGCCFGGVCDHSWAITFPQQSPAYYHQQSNGSFHGFTLAAGDDGRPIVAAVFPGSEAERSGMRPGEILQSANALETPTLESAFAAIGQSGQSLTLLTSAKQHQLSIAAFPEEAMPVHPTQLYSSVNAMLLACLAFAVFPHRRRDGEVFVLLMCGYAITRFLLEVIRTDEGSFSQTGMTISQNVSVGMMVGVIALALYLWKQPRGTYWPIPAAG